MVQEPRLDYLVRDILSGVARGLVVESPAFREGERIPREHTCEGPDTPPPLTVSGIPREAASLILVMYDPDAPVGTFTHWTSLIRLEEGAESVRVEESERVEGVNDFGSRGYGGPCPPRGHGAHRYYFLAVALNTLPALSQGFRVSEALEAMRRSALSYGSLMGTYSRP